MSQQKLPDLCGSCAWPAGKSSGVSGTMQLEDTLRLLPEQEWDTSMIFCTRTFHFSVSLPDQAFVFFSKTVVLFRAL